MLILREKIGKEEWNTFVAAHAEDGGVLQSWEWGEIEEKEGHHVWRLAFADDGVLVACCLLVERRLPFGWKYLYAPRGPVVRIMNYELGIRNVITDLEKFAKERGAVFLRFEPPYTNYSLLVTRYSLRKVESVQPKQTLRIDLTKSEDELLQSMHQKTRYNIGLAEKRGVEVTPWAPCLLNKVPMYHDASKESNFGIFWKLLQTTTKRDGFRMHPRAHYETILSTLDTKLFFASYNGQPLAATLVAFFGDTAYYLHGASANEHRDVMASYALHWHIIREAKRRGCTVYDLWGVDEKRWPGVTRFKHGFAPATPYTTYAGTFDLPTRKFPYLLYRIRQLL